MIENTAQSQEDWITTFFEKWSEKDNHSLRAALFHEMLDGHLNEKICIQEDDIIHFRKRIFQNGRLKLDGQTYWINRFFLTAACLHPSQWSIDFVILLGTICGYLKKFNEQLGTLSLNPKAYPHDLLNQFQYLIAKYKHLQGNIESSSVPDRPQNMLLHPDLCETYHEWMNIDKHLSKFFPKKNLLVVQKYCDKICEAILNAPFVSTLSPQVKSLLQEYKSLMMSNASSDLNMISCIGIFYAIDTELLDDSICLFIIRNYQAISSIGPAIQILYKTSPTLLTYDYLDMLTSSDGISAIQIANTIRLLYQVNPALLTQDRCTLLKEHAVIARNIAQILNVLKNTKEDLINEANLMLVTKNHLYVWRLAEALTILYNDVKPNIIDEFLLQRLVDCGEYAIEYASIMCFFNRINPALLNVKNLELINIQRHDSGRFLVILRMMQEIAPSFILQENIATLLAVSKYSSGIIKTLRFLQNTNPSLLSKCNLNLILGSSHQLINLQEMLSMLHRINSNFINEENLNHLFKNDIHRVLSVKLALQKLSHSNPSLITNETIKDLFCCPQSKLTFFGNNFHEKSTSEVALPGVMSRKI